MGGALETLLVDLQVAPVALIALREGEGEEGRKGGREGKELFRRRGKKGKGIVLPREGDCNGTCLPRTSLTNRLQKPHQVGLLKRCGRNSWRASTSVTPRPPLRASKTLLVELLRFWAWMSGVSNHRQNRDKERKIIPVGTGNGMEGESRRRERPRGTLARLERVVGQSGAAIVRHFRCATAMQPSTEER